MALHHSPKIITNELIFCIDTANTKSYPGTGTAISDICYSNNCTVSTTPIIDADGAMTFDGTYNVSIPSATWDKLTGTNMSVSVWVKPEASSLSVNMLYVAAGGLTFRLYRNDAWADNRFGWLTYYVATGSPEANSSDIRNIDYTPDVWINTTWTLEANTPNATMIGYVNGEPVSTASKTNFSTWYTPSGNMTISLSNAYLGGIGPLHMYNKTLTPDEVKQNFNAHRGRYGI